MITDLLHRLVARPFVYDAAQQLAGAERIRRSLKPHFAGAAGRLVLDVGAGTGLYLSCLPGSVRYLWFDRDVEKLRGFQAGRTVRGTAMLGDATAIGLRDSSVDYVACTAVTHHLTDPQLLAALKEMARVARERLILLDAVTSGRWVSRVLWKYDRGSHPRSAEGLIAAIEAHFDIEHVEYCSVVHRYVLLVAKPR